MAILLAVLNFSKKHAQPIIVVLLGVIASGSIAGGLWIRALQQRAANLERELESAKRLYDQQLAIEQRRAATATTVADVMNKKLRARLDEINRSDHRLKEYVEKVDAVVARHFDADRSLAQKLKDGLSKPIAKVEAAGMAAQLTASVDETRAGVSTAKDWVSWLSDETGDDVVAYSAPTPYAPPAVELRGGGNWFVYLVILGGLATLTWLFLRLLWWTYSKIRIRHSTTDN